MGFTTQGETHGMAILDEWKVRKMRKAHYKDRKPIALIAKEFDISYGTCYDAVMGKTWRHVGGLPSIGNYI
jgi:hypothetical protein